VIYIYFKKNRSGFKSLSMDSLHHNEPVHAVFPPNILQGSAGSLFDVPKSDMVLSKTNMCNRAALLQHISSHQHGPFSIGSASASEPSNRSTNEGMLAHLQESNSMEDFSSAQAAYINVPHTVQKQIMPIMLPNSKERMYGNEPFVLPFPHIRKGDIAFYLRIENNWHTDAVQRSLSNPSLHNPSVPLALMCTEWSSVVHRRKRMKMQTEEIGRSIMMSEGSQLFVNLQTVNYILHGIQHYGGSGEEGWRDCFWKGFGLHLLHHTIQEDAEKLCTHVIRCCMTPFGVVSSDVSHCSDQQVAMVIDGRVECMRNYWASFVRDSASDDMVSMQNRRLQGNSSAIGGTGAADGNELAMPQPGDELILILESTTMDVDCVDGDLEHELDKWTYMLPNHGRGDSSQTVKAVFPMKHPVVGSSMQQANTDGKAAIWQLVPSFASLANRACWERKGFWRLGTVY
jgi:hypothetical protein